MRAALTINLELGGRRAAFARVELLDETGEAQVARVALSGRIDRAAERRLERALADLAPRRVSRVVLDCSDVSGLGVGQVNRLVDAMARFDRPPGPVDVCGLPSSLRERLAGRTRRDAGRRDAEAESAPPGDRTT
jgi:hypothetical protein